MKKLLAFVAPIALGAGICGMLRADDSAPPAPTVSQSGDSYLAADQYTWYVEHESAIAKDAESTGVQAVLEAAAFLHDREPQVQIDFFNKALYDSKMRPVQREIRMELFKLYKQQGQSDKATEQLQALMNDQ